MRSAIITRSFAFEAMHYLPGHRGKCRRPHGHSYRLEIALRGPIKNAPGTSDDGMVMDFGDLKEIVHTTILDQLADDVSRGACVQGLCGGLDHNDLNTLTGIRTTAENLAHWIWDALVVGGIPDELLYRVRLWETEQAYVEITRAERE